MSAAEARITSRCGQSELVSLGQLSARIGRDPLLVQASSGNTSIKTDGILWVKASGKWLADAEQHQIFVPVDLAEVRECLRQNTDFAGIDSSSSQTRMSASIETFMHAAFPHRVVIHVHSVNTIAWAVRQDAQVRLAEQLAGLPWQWIPYVPSGLPLGREIANVVIGHPKTDILVLGNHGLVIGGEDCDTAERLLIEIERRLAISPRVAPEARSALLTRLARISPWRLPDLRNLHALGTDPTSRRILKGGVLYPCQAIFLGRTAPLIPCSVPFSDVRNHIGEHDECRSLLILEGSGVMVSERITRAEQATLTGLMEVLQRIGPAAPIRYLRESDVTGVLTGTLGHYRQAAENSEPRSGFCAITRRLRHRLQASPRRRPRTPIPK